MKLRKSLKAVLCIAHRLNIMYRKSCILHLFSAKTLPIAWGTVHRWIYPYSFTNGLSRCLSCNINIVCLTPNKASIFHDHILPWDDTTWRPYNYKEVHKGLLLVPKMPSISCEEQDSSANSLSRHGEIWVAAISSATDSELGGLRPPKKVVSMVWKSNQLINVFQTGVGGQEVTLDWPLCAFSAWWTFNAWNSQTQPHRLE